MDTEPLIKFFEQAFGNESETPIEGGKLIEICSGGTRDSDKQELPVLYASESLAFAHWIDSCEDYFAPHYPIRWRWHQRPIVRRLAITVTDLHEQERLVQTRCSITAKIVFEKIISVEKPREAPSSKPKEEVEPKD